MKRIGAHEILVLYATKARAQCFAYEAELLIARAEVESLRAQLDRAEKQLARNRRLRNLWTIRCHKARDNRDMWRTRALQAHGTKRRIRTT